MSSTKIKLIPCRERGCGHEPFSTQQGERMHFHRVHSGRVPDPVSHTAKIDRRTRAWRDANPNLAKSIGSPGVPKKQKKAVEAAQPETEAKFCPCCGFNLVIFNMAMTLAKKYEGKVV